MGLHTAQVDLDDTQDVNEVTTPTGYERESIAANGGTSWTAGTAGNDWQYSNAVEIQFDAPTANWGTITHATLGIDGTTGGVTEFFWVAALTSSKTVSLGDGAPKILVGQLRISRATC